MSDAFIIILFSLPPLLFLYLVAVYLRTRVPIILTPKKYLPTLLREIPVAGKTVYDLGCGTGRVLFAARQSGARAAVGFELSPLHVWYIRIKSRLTGVAVTVHQEDIFFADIKEADIIYLFLVKPVVRKVWPKIVREAKRGAQVVVLSDDIGVKWDKVIKTRPDSEQSTKFYVYKVVGGK